MGEIFGKGASPATALLRSPSVIIASIGLWGMNVYFFRIFGINYVRILNHDLVIERRVQRKEKDEADIPSTSRVSDVGVVETIDTDGESDTNVIDRRKVKELEMSFIRTDRDTTECTSNESDEDYDESDDSLDESVSVAQSREITEYKLLYLSLFLLVLLHASSITWIQLFHGTTIGAIFFFYFAVGVGFMLPLALTAWLRAASIVVLKRAYELVKPRCNCFFRRTPRPIPFIDVFFADAMCSLSKVFFDWGMIWTLAANYPNPVPRSAASIVIPSSFASLPFLIRARQCHIMYIVGNHKKDPQKYLHVLNAIKYSTSLFPLIVSAYMKTSITNRMQSRLEVALVVLLTVNATYSLIWDITMDWGMMQNPSAIVEHTVSECSGGYSAVGMTSSTDGIKNSRFGYCADTALRPSLRFGASLSLFIILTDIILRFSWILRFSEAKLFPSNDAFILCTQFLEVFRRAMWNLLRVEWEHIKQVQSKKLFEMNEKSGPEAGIFLKKEGAFDLVKDTTIPCALMRRDSKSQLPTAAMTREKTKLRKSTV